ncbi:MAG: porin [Succinivibrio sp.]
MQFKIGRILAAMLCLGAAAQQAGAATVYEKDGAALDIFGRVDASYMNDHAARSLRGNMRSTGVDNSIMNTARFGISGRSKISQSAYAIGMAEWHMPFNSGSSAQARYMFAGINAQQYGTLIAGRGNDAYAAVAGATDIFDMLDGETNDYYIFGDTVPGQIMYSLSAMGWDARVSVQTAVENVNEVFDIDSGAAFSIATRFKSGISFAYGASYTDFSYEEAPGDQVEFFGGMFRRGQKAATDESDAQYGLGHHPSYKVNKGIAISYGNLGDGLYIAALYNVTRYKGLPHHIYDYELAASYAFASGIELKAGYGVQLYRDAAAIEDLTLGVAWNPVPAFKIYAEGQFDLGARPERLYGDQWIADRALGESRFSAGMRYMF